MFCEGACRKVLSAAFHVFNVARNIFISDKIKKKKDYAYQEFLREKKGVDILYPFTSRKLDMENNTRLLNYRNESHHLSVYFNVIFREHRRSRAVKMEPSLW